MLLPGLESYYLGTRHGADALNSLNKEDFEVGMLEVVKCRVNCLLQEPEYAELSAELKM